MKALHNAEVKQVFESYPPAIRNKLLALRESIYQTASITAGVGPIEETLKWNEPAYLTSKTKSGSTIRIGWKSNKPDEYAMYFHCQTNLVETFRTLFPNDFCFEGNRAIIFQQTDIVPTDSLGICIAAALTYHLKKQS